MRGLIAANSYISVVEMEESTEESPLYEVSVSREFVKQILEACEREGYTGDIISMYIVGQEVLTAS